MKINDDVNFLNNKNLKFKINIIFQDFVKTLVVQSYFPKTFLKFHWIEKEDLSPNFPREIISSIN